MSFTPGIPRSGQSLGNSRPQVQGNFDYINTAFAINHVAFSSTGVGKHKFIQMPEQSPNGPATLAGEGALYTKDSAGTQLFWRPENTLANGTEIQMTNVAPINATSGYSFLPGGLLIQWDTITTASTTTPVTFPVTFSSIPYSIVITLNATPAGALSFGASNLMAGTFDIKRSPITGNATVFYMAIGPKI